MNSLNRNIKEGEVVIVKKECYKATRTLEGLNVKVVLECLHLLPEPLYSEALLILENNVG